MPQRMATDHDASEKFIHDALIREVERGLPTITQMWKEVGRVASFMIAWPSKDIVDNDGNRVTGPISYDLLDDVNERRKIVREILTRTKPYGLLLCEQREKEVRVLFETKHGTKSWHFPIEKHGPDRVLGSVSTNVDVHHIGILWRPPTSLN